MSAALALNTPAQADAPQRITMLGGSHIAEALRRLPNLDRVPKGCHALRDWHLGGAYVVIDLAIKAMVHGDTVAIRWSEHRPPSPHSSRSHHTEGRPGRPP